MYVRILWVAGDGNKPIPAYPKGSLNQVQVKAGCHGNRWNQGLHTAEVLTPLGGSISSFVGIIHVYTAD